MNESKTAQKALDGIIAEASAFSEYAPLTDDAFRLIVTLAHSVEPALARLREALEEQGRYRPDTGEWHVNDCFLDSNHNRHLARCTQAHNALEPSIQSVMTLSELQALRDAATAGPWRSRHGSEIFPGCVSGPKSEGIVEAVGHASQDIDADMDFIASIHDAVAMLEAVEQKAQEMASDQGSDWVGNEATCTRNAAGEVILAILGGSHAE